jgi:hypothetical protein
VGSIARMTDNTTMTNQKSSNKQQSSDKAGKTNIAKQLEKLKAHDKNEDKKISKLEAKIGELVVRRVDKGGGPKTRSGPTWADVLRNPFGGKVAHIPDTQTTPSALMWSEIKGTLTLTGNNGTGTSHAGGLILMPYPRNALFTLQESTTGNTVLTDVNNGGTAYINAQDVPNLSSLVGGSTITYAGRIRCAGAAIRITYMGTEQMRSGVVYAGSVVMNRAPSVTAASGTVDSVVSSIGPAILPTINTSDMRKSMKNTFEARVPSSGSITVRWEPEGVPSYQVLDQATYIGTTGRTAGVSSTTSGLWAPNEGSGCEAGQSLLALVIAGDTSAAASASGNTYSYEARWLWEVIPDQPEAICEQVSPSYADSHQVDEALNMLVRMPAGFVSTSGKSF